MTALATARQEWQSPLVAGDALVLEGRPLQAGSGPGPSFSEDMWDLSAGVLRAGMGGAFRLDFGTITDEHLRARAKEYMYARLRLTIRADRVLRPLAISGVYAHFDGLRRFLTWLTTEGCLRLDAVDQAKLDTYLHVVRAGVRGGGVSTVHVLNRVAVVRDLHQCGDHLDGDRLTVLPWRGRSPATVANHRPPNENSTPRIPEEVLGPYLAWSLFYVQRASHDVLAARDELKSYAGRRTSGGVLASIDRWAGQRRAQGRGIPRTPSHGAMGPPRPNLSLISAQVGCSPRALVAHRGRLEALASELGWEDGGLDTAISLRPDTGSPWRPRFSPREVAHEERMLRTACYVVIAYLSGMRDSEVKNLRRGCHTVRKDAEGAVYRHYLGGQTYKRRGASGRKARWVVLDVVGQAVEVLERLHPDQPLLFADAGGAVVRGWIPGHLNALATNFDRRFGGEGQPVIPTLVDGTWVMSTEGDPWWFTTRQFRRTLAWFLARRPYGVIAGMRQYQRASVQMFEGYAGQTASGFADEVEAERRLAQEDDVFDLYRDWCDGVRVGGPGGGEMEGLFRATREQVGSFPGRVGVSEREIRSMLRNTARTLYPGVLNDCFFVAERGLCVAHLEPGDRTSPQTNNCQPGRCRNSIVAERHLPAVDLVISEARVLLTTKPLSTHQREAVSGVVAQWESARSTCNPRSPETGCS